MTAKGFNMSTDKDGKSNSNAQAAAPKKTGTGASETVSTPPLPVQTNDDPRGHVGAQDEQVDYTLTPPAPEESVEKVSN
jgi:hypothetical protein